MHTVDDSFPTSFSFFHRRNMIAALQPDGIKKLHPEHATVTYFYRVLPNNNPENPASWAFDTWVLGTTNHVERVAAKSTWHSARPPLLTRLDARTAAIGELVDDARYFDGPRNFLFIPWDERSAWEPALLKFAERVTCQNKLSLPHVLPLWGPLASSQFIDFGNEFIVTVHGRKKVITRDQSKNVAEMVASAITA